MPAGLKQTSSVVTIGFEARELVANTFTQSEVDLNLSPLDSEVFVVLAVNMDPRYPDSLAGIDTSVNVSLTSTRFAAVATLTDANCIAAASNAIKAAGFVDAGVGFQTALETPPSNLDYIGIVATNNFFVQIEGAGNLNTKAVTGKMYGYRARADSAIYAALVQSEALSA